MAIIRCANGHFYDSAKSRDCPYCAKRNEQEKRVIQNNPYMPYRGGVDREGVTVAMPRQPQGGSQDVRISAAPVPGVRGISAGDDPVTVGIFAAARGTAYVTGWLVSVDGPEKGRDYRIRHGMNWIGSSTAMDIVIYADETVAPVKHCCIAYDNKSNCFFAVPGSGSITYYNGQILETSQELKLGDELGIGKSKYEFIPYCREGHTWEEKEEKKEREEMEEQENTDES